jgi:ubiquinone/menaquinone biosynthesis C-methylase UbiE
MGLTFKVRDFFQPRGTVLKEAGIETGFYVLDFGCGPGSYITPLYELIGPSGRINIAFSQTGPKNNLAMTS